MLVDQNLANFSDIAFRTALVVYTLALFLSLYYYGRMHTIIEARRARTRVAKELAPAASGGSVATLPPAGSAAGAAGEAGAGNAAAAPAANEHFVDRLGNMTQSLIWVGIAVHVVAVVLRGLATGRFPFGNMYEYMLMVTAGAMIAAAIAFQRKEWRPLWPWLLAPILALMFYGGTKLYAEAAPVVPALRSFWLPIHVTIVALGAAIGLLSGLMSLLYLLRTWQPKGKESGLWGIIARPLPTGKKLDQLAYRTAVITLPTLGLGIVLGAIWAETAWGRPWGWDPKETMSFVTWVLYAAYLHARATPSFRKAAPWINVLALAAMIFNLFFINLVVSGLHSYAGLN